MKKGLLGFLFLFASFAATFGQSQKISDMPTYIGDPAGGFLPIVINGLNRKIDAGSLKASGGGTVTLSALRLTTVQPGVMYTTSDFGGGTWAADTADHTSTDNVGMTIIAAGNVRVKRVNAGRLNPKWFGAKGDGVTDDYAALQLFNAYVNATGGNCEIVYPAGVYYVNRYRISGGAGANAITGLSFSNVNNVKVYGYGAAISVKGNFNRAWDFGASNAKQSYSNAVIPFDLTNCSNVYVEGLELDGNVDLMTRDAGVVEGANHGLSISGGNNLTFKNMYIHHFAADGIYIASTGLNPRISAKQITVENVRSVYNARQGLSIIQLRNATFNNCDFSFTGASAGTYGSHSPGAGVDFEPNYTTPTVDFNTGELHFNNCNFVANNGAQISSNISVRDVYFKGGVVDGTTAAGAYTIICNMYNINFDGVEIHTGPNGAIYPAWLTGVGQKSTFRGCRIFSSSNGILLAVKAEFGVLIENCELVGEHTAALASYFPYINAQNFIFRNNSVFYAAGQYGANNSGLIQQGLVAENNKFTTALDTTGNTNHFTVSYSGTKVVRNETFPAKGVLGSGFAEPYVFNSTVTPSNGGLNLVGTGTLFSNFDGASVLGIGNNVLNIQTRKADNYNVGFSQSAIGATSGLHISTPISNRSVLATGGYLRSNLSNYFTPLETIMTAFEQNLGKFRFLGKGQLTPGTLDSLRAWATIDSIGLSLRQGNNPISGLDLKAASAISASMNIPAGIAPTTPNEGDVWQDGTHTYMRIGGANAQLDNSLAPTFAAQSAYTVFGNHTAASATPTFAKLPVQSINATGSTYNGTKYLRDDGAWATVTGGGVTSNIASAEVATDVTTTATTASNVTGLSFAVDANTVYTITGALSIGTSSSGGVKLALTAPTGTSLHAQLIGFSTSFVGFRMEPIQVSGTLSSTFITVATTAGTIQIKGTVKTGATAGVLQLQFAAGVAAQTITVFGNNMSFLTLQPRGTVPGP